ncbi:hypothetical protein [Delftia sp. GW456-R20]|uniref:hypothetical protein n=1 Tax=Delftia sp. GW456-R20 TaxID=1827145 RepID=UPI0012E80460|nr:hypothetical protein [Delftia sp. GW456-R20]
MSGPAGPAPGAGQARAAQQRRLLQLVDELDQDLQLLDVGPRPRSAPAWSWICVSGRRRRQGPCLINLQLLDVVATVALRACLVDVDLHVWSSTRRWPGLGGAAAPPAAAGR